MIQGRVVADDSPTGEFTGGAGVSQPQCTDDVGQILQTYAAYLNFMNPQTAATHVNNNEKTSVTLIWTAPAAGTGAIRFR